MLTLGRTLLLGFALPCLFRSITCLILWESRTQASASISGVTCVHPRLEVRYGSRFPPCSQNKRNALSLCLSLSLTSVSSTNTTTHVTESPTVPFQVQNVFRVGHGICKASPRRCGCWDASLASRTAPQISDRGCACLKQASKYEKYEMCVPWS